ncbi:hypothetical protein [Deinococcus sp.]|uniref:hypothetical protein n=1 Tax=Deinococcus sp. TaxID=47478 RepID=UPI003918F0DE
MTTTVNRRIHFFDVEALQFDPQDPSISTPADVDALFTHIQSLRYARGTPGGSVLTIWNTEVVATVDHVDPNFITGHFSKVRADRLPGIVSPANGYQRIALGVDEALYEAAHYVYFRNSRILALEYNEHAPHAKIFAEYLGKIAHRAVLPIDHLSLPIKVDPNTVQRLRDMGVVTQVEASIYTTQLQALTLSSGIAQALRATASAVRTNIKASVKLARERPAKERPRGLGAEMKTDVIDLWTETGDVLTSLKVWVEPAGGGSPVPIDFKRDRFSTSLPVLVSNGGIDSGDIYAKIVKYFNDSGMEETATRRV